jgi:hypothetical protein
MGNDPMRDFMRKQKKLEASAFKGLWKSSKPQAPRRTRNFEQPHYRKKQPLREIQHKTIIHHDTYTPIIHDDHDRKTIIYQSGLDWNMLKLIIIIFGGLLFFGLLWFGDQTYVQTHTPTSNSTQLPVSTTGTNNIPDLSQTGVFVSPLDLKDCSPTTISINDNTLIYQSVTTYPGESGNRVYYAYKTTGKVFGKVNDTQCFLQFYHVHVPTLPKGQQIYEILDCIFDTTKGIANECNAVNSLNVTASDYPDI